MTHPFLDAIKARVADLQEARQAEFVRLSARTSDSERVQALSVLIARSRAGDQDGAQRLAGLVEQMPAPFGDVVVRMIAEERSPLRPLPNAWWSDAKSAESEPLELSPGADSSETGSAAAPVKAQHVAGLPISGGDDENVPRSEQLPWYEQPPSKRRVRGLRLAEELRRIFQQRHIKPGDAGWMRGR